ncbi:hypothetical protein BJ508DRAFT_50277 [Ascobolus immersus RN42]|uniref:F-box domain-containing protein n=1 Tax=Ascobolus immersus RN42 TaxID=1160509 RepID=A0A3N4HLI3_ASCIM|nr:hypothetical protein BJ508DRAFT_50277 [Ascobolus immersus RN42]
MTADRFNHLPTELYLEIANYLTLKDLLYVSRTTQHLHTVFVSILFTRGIKLLREQRLWPKREAYLRENELALDANTELRPEEIEPPVVNIDDGDDNSDQEEDEDIDLEDFTTDSEHDPAEDGDDEGWENVIDEEEGDVPEGGDSDSDDDSSEGEQEMIQWHNNLVPSGIFEVNPFHQQDVAAQEGASIPSSHTPPEAEDEIRYIELIKMAIPAEKNMVRSVGLSATPREMEVFLGGMPNWRKMGTRDSDKVCWLLTEACSNLNYELVKYLAGLMGKAMINHRVFTPARTWVMEHWETYAHCDELGITSLPGYRDAVVESDGEELDIGGKYLKEKKVAYEKSIKELKEEQEEIERKYNWTEDETREKMEERRIKEAQRLEEKKKKMDQSKAEPETDGDIYQENPQRGIWCSILKVLLKNGLTFNVSPHNPFRRASIGPGNPLIYACYHLHTHLIRLLLANGANPNTTERFRLQNGEVHPISPLSILMDVHFHHDLRGITDHHVRSWHASVLEMLTLLVSHGATLNTTPSTASPLYALVEFSFGSTRAETAEQFTLHLLSLGADPNHAFRPNRDISLLEWLLHEINFETWPDSRVTKLVRTVLEKGAGINHRDNLTNTPLLVAVTNLLDIHSGHAGVVELQTAKEEKARWGHMMAVIPILIEFGADPWLVGEVDGNRAHSVKVVAMMGNEELMELVLPGEENKETREKWLKDEEFRASEGVVAVEKVDPESIWGDEMETMGDGTEENPFTGMVNVGGDFVLELPEGVQVGDEVEVEVVGVEVGGQAQEDDGHDGVE